MSSNVSPQLAQRQARTTASTTTRSETSVRVRPLGAPQPLRAGRRPKDHGQSLPDTHRAHWQHTYTRHPGRYGEQPSAPAVHAAALFHAAGARGVLELGAGHGRDSLYSARAGFTVQATDFSATVVRDPLPLPDASLDAVFAHMLQCMALSTEEIHALVGEIARVLRPGGTFVWTVRHTGDAHYGTGRFHRGNICEHGGFAVHFFDRALVDALAEGWILDEVHAFEEGELPRRLWRVTQTRPG
ncbi:methyltransferase domain-containing protein [Streptomyces sp. NPDC097610]|uniref:class I SAM-dependent methyltransferase n=1 Tax=Streptomyces sp. NPDC097610 TaxID=3157227 RepID=UPI00332DFE84